MSDKSKAVEGVDPKDYQPKVEHEAGKHGKVDPLPRVGLHGLPREQLQQTISSHLSFLNGLKYILP